MGGEWRQSTWGEEISLEYGKRLSGYAEGHGPVRVFGTNGPVGWTEEPLASGPGVIVGRKGAYRGVHYSPNPFYVIDTAYYVRPKSDLDMRWLYYAIIHYQLTDLNDGSPIPSTTRSAVYVRELEVPPRVEQEKIADILGTLDEKIAINHQISDILEAVVRAIFKAWFVDFEPVKAKAGGAISFRGMPQEVFNQLPDRFVESELGRVPKGWEIRNLGDLVSITKGRSYKSSELVEGDTALVTLKSFNRGGGYRQDGLKPYSGKYKPDQVISPGELVVAFTDVTQQAEVIGKPAIVLSDPRYTTLVASLDTAILRPSSTDMTRSFLYCLLRTDRFQAHAYSHTSGTTVLHLGKNALPIYKFVCPPSDLVGSFEQFAGAVFSKIEQNQCESRTLSSIRDTLLSKLISGEIRVPEALEGADGG